MSLIKEALFDFISSCDRNIKQLYFGINQDVNYFKLAYICDFMRVYTSGFTNESLLGCNLARVAQLVKCLVTSGYPDGSSSGDRACQEWQFGFIGKSLEHLLDMNQSVTESLLCDSRRNHETLP